MSITRYEPWSLMRRLRQFEHLFDDSFAPPAVSGATPVDWIPSVDVREEADRFVVNADLPGVDLKDIEVTAQDGTLTIRGERHAQHKESGQDFERVERVAGRFLRRFALPETAQVDAITARQANGVLEVVIPKQAKVAPQRIQVQAA